MTEPVSPSVAGRIQASSVQASPSMNRSAPPGPAGSTAAAPSSTSERATAGLPE